MIRYRAQYSPGFSVYNSGYNEIRWDVVGCNLRCQFCWSPASRPEEKREKTIIKETKEVLSSTIVTGGLNSLNQTKTFIRFTGGEPTLRWEALSEIFEAFKENDNTKNIPMLIQTNAIEIGKGLSLDNLLRIRQPFLFEVSLKGTNQEEFAILTGKEPELYHYQLEGYRKLLELSRQNSLISVVAVLGIYHSSVNGKSKYAFINPRNERLLFEDINFWDKDFANIWSKAKQKWVEPLRMSPKGVWENLLARCGPKGSGILKNFPNGTDTNITGQFPMKPKSFEYARLIVQKRFWS